MKVDYGLCSVCGHNTRLNRGRSAEHTQWRVRQDRRTRLPQPVFYDTRKPCPGSGQYAEGHVPAVTR